MTTHVQVMTTKENAVIGQEKSGRERAGIVGRVAILLYGLGSYVSFLVTAAVSMAFIGNFGLSRTMDSAPTSSLGWAVSINLALLGVFAVQHSVMARPAFKRWWTQIIPAAAERSTYVLLSNAAVLLLYALWEPIGGTVWSVSNTTASTAIYVFYGAGWVALVGATLCIDHLHLFGLRQVYCHLVGTECVEKSFRTPGPYKIVRHPIYVCWLTIFWATPTMTAAHLLFALATTAYILIAIQLEERDLVDMLGDPYAEYRKTVPMLIPRVVRK